MNLFHRLDPALVSAALLLALVGAEWVGRRVARTRAGRADGALCAQVASAQAGALGLLGLLLAFTFSAAAERYDMRRQLVLVDANAIGTAWLRTDLLDEPARSEERALLRRYVEARLAFASTSGQSARLGPARADAEALQAQFWSGAVAAARVDPGNVALPLLLSALNDVIDTHAARLTALEARIPPSIFGLLFTVAIGAMALVGYGFGLAARRDLPSMLTLALLIAASAYVILDLDEPRRGLIQVSQQRLVDLQEQMRP